MKSISTNLFTPRLKVLTEDQKEILFLSALEILERTGVRVDHAEGLELLSSSGASVGKNQRVHIKSNLVEDALASAPSQIAIYDRLGNQKILLENRSSYFASQVDSTYFFDPFDRSRRQCVRSDAKLGAVLCDALTNIDMVSFSSLYSDVPGEIAIRVGHKDTVMNCTKPLMHGTGDFASLKAVAEMAALVVGGWDELARRPYYIHYAEPLSPLTHTNEGVAKLLYCVERGIPVIYTPMTAGGTSAPVTAAGNLAALLAETLSGLVMAQLKQRGAPVIVGGVPTILDMSSTFVSYGAPEMSLWSAGMAEMAEYLDLPLMSTAGCTDAVTFDEQAAAESAISCLMAALSGGNLVHDVGFAESANHASLELIAAGDELIGMIRHIMNGIEVSPEALAIDAIHQVGHGGTYLDKKHTFKYFKERWRPSLMARINHESWKNDGSRSMGTRCRERVCKIIKEHEPVPLTDDVISELDRQEKYWFDELVSS
jgi:trimethylamine--corrinoid protein Co-methyltransferase